MAKPRNRTVDYLAYLALRLTVMFLHMFTVRTIYAGAASLGNAWYRFDKRHRDRAASHVRASFPEWSERRVQEVVKGSFRNMLYLAVEVLFVTRLVTPVRLNRYVNLRPCENIHKAMRIVTQRKTGAILVSGHFGTWEIAGYSMAALGFDCYAIARKLDNPWLNEYLLGVRENMGLKVVDKIGAMRMMDDILSAKHYVNIIADQDAGKRGVFVDFFGRKASSYKGPALTAIRYNVPIIVGTSRRIDEQFKFEISSERVIEPEEWADKKDPVHWITQEYTRAMEGAIRRNPEQYLWIYRRWKTRPPDEIKAAARQTTAGEQD